LQDNISILHKMADALMKWETIDRAQIDDLMAGKEPKAPVEDIILPAVEVFESNNEQQDIADNKSESLTKKPAKQV